MRNTNLNNQSTSAETSILKSSNRALKDYKLNPHYEIKDKVKFEEPEDVVWEKDSVKLEHFKSLKQFEKLHDAKLYLNSMLPPISK